MTAAVFDNLSLTDDASKRLLSFPFFRDSNLGETTKLAFLWWVLWSRIPGKDGRWLMSKGPHFTLATMDLKDLADYPRTYCFVIGKRVLCVQFSKDVDFDQTKPFRLDFTDEFILYPAILDEGDAATLSGSLAHRIQKPNNAEE